MSKFPSTSQNQDDAPTLAPPGTYAEAVYQRLRDEMFRGGLRPRDRLAEVEIARRMGVSQGPVREALARLRAEGLVVGQAHRGSFVSEISVSDVKDVYAIRQVLEQYALRLALPKMGDAEYKRLEEDVEQMRLAVDEGDTARHYAHDMRFHRRIYEWAGSPTVLQFWETIEAKIRKFAIYWTPVAFRQDPTWPVQIHYDLMDRMRDGYGPALEEELERHLKGIWSGPPTDLGAADLVESGEVRAPSAARRARP